MILFEDKNVTFSIRFGLYKTQDLHKMKDIKYISHGLG